MKPILILLAGLSLLAWRGAAAAPAEVPEVRVSPRARAVLDRVNAAYSSLEGWTASMETQLHITQPGGTEFFVALRRADRYLPSGGPTGYYSAVDYRDGVAQALFWQDTAAQYRVIPPVTGKVTRPPIGTTSAPDEGNRPAIWVQLRSQLGDTHFVRYGGKESVAGQSCDVLELGRIFWTPAKADGPKQPGGIHTYRFYVDPAGFIVRATGFSDSPEKPEGRWTETRITYDAAAKLTAADFSRENLDREAAKLLQGQPMPEFEQELFARGGTLPEASFTAWADKKPFRLSDLKGRVVVVETWTSWCHFCKEAFPFYEKMRQKLADQDVVFVAVSFDEKLANYEKWMNEHGDGYGFKFGRIDAEDPKKALKDFKGSLPAFYVLGRDGRIISSYVGYSYGRAGEDPRLLAALREAGTKI